MDEVAEKWKETINAEAIKDAAQTVKDKVSEAAAEVGWRKLCSDSCHYAYFLRSFPLNY